MADVFTKEKRSEVMSLIRSSGNKNTELRLAKLLRAHRLSGWRRQAVLKAAEVRVRPDFVFRTRRVVIFVDGCFWHGCPRHGTKPRENASFWKRKLERNRERDRLVTRALRRAGWQVLRIWEHEMARKREARLMARIRKMLCSDLTV